MIYNFFSTQSEPETKLTKVRKTKSCDGSCVLARRPRARGVPRIHGDAGSWLCCFGCAPRASPCHGLSDGARPMSHITPRTKPQRAPGAATANTPRSVRTVPCVTFYHVQPRTGRRGVRPSILDRITCSAVCISARARCPARALLALPSKRQQLYTVAGRVPPSLHMARARRAPRTLPEDIARTPHAARWPRQRAP